jgi:hypothetical protein
MREFVAEGLPRSLADLVARDVTMASPRRRSNTREVTRKSWRTFCFVFSSHVDGGEIGASDAIRHRHISYN